MEAISNPLEDESGTIVAAVAIVTSIAAATVIARLYVRTVMIRSLGWDVSERNRLHRHNASLTQALTGHRNHSHNDVRDSRVRIGRRTSQ